MPNPTVSQVVGLLPAGVPVHSSSGNVANANAVATLAAVAGVTNYLTGILIAPGGSTAAAVVSATITGLLGGTMTLTVGSPAGAGLAGTPIFIPFATPLPASAAGVAIVLTVPAFGAGNTNSTATLTGFQA